MSTNYRIRSFGHRKESFLAMFTFIMGRSRGNIAHARMNRTFQNDVFRLASSLVSPSTAYYTQLFATGDSKGSIRLWDINDFQKSPIFRSKKTIRGTGKEHLDALHWKSVSLEYGPIDVDVQFLKAVIFCEVTESRFSFSFRHSWSRIHLGHCSSSGLAEWQWTIEYLRVTIIH